jgi:uncharacterized protein YprB with RNaseH-like and TPR domain
MSLSPAALRLHRVARLREHAVVPDAASRARGPSPQRAADLARTLGGSVISGPAGSVVVVESSVSLPASIGALRELPEPLDASRPIVCLDTETTGLGTAVGTVPFLVGLGRWRQDEFVVRQLLLPDHADEGALLDAIAQHIPADAWLVTYNGRAFDWPLLVTRFRMHRQPPPSYAGHLDLLGLARQVWRHRLPDARLGSVEAGVAGVRRADDLPGALIPERYFAYLRSGRAELLADVLRHNRQDIVSLALLLRVLAEDVLPAREDVDAGDLAGLGRAYARRRRFGEALACYDSALERLAPWRQRDLQDRLSVDRARMLARLGRAADAASAWEAVALDGGPLAALAWIQVAKGREHRTRDPHAALQAARRAEVLAARSRMRGERDRIVERDLPRRIARLRRLLGEAASTTSVGWPDGGLLSRAPPR